MSYSLSVHDARDFKVSLQEMKNDDGSIWFWAAEISWYSGEGKKSEGLYSMNFFFHSFEEIKEFAENMKLFSDIFYEHLEHELSKEK